MEILEKIAILSATIILILGSNSVYGNLDCEDLTMEECAFAVSSSGARCVLEKSTLPNGKIMPECQTSLTMSERPEEWIESDECIKGCGLERESYGLSTDALMEVGFVDKLCSQECQNNCPNIIDLYLKLAAGEGVYLSHLCTKHKSKARHLIVDPYQVAQLGMEGYQAGINDKINNNHKVTMPKEHVELWDSSVVSLGTPTPQPSQVYGPSPAPTVGPFFATPPRSILTFPSPSIVVAPPTQNPSPLSQPTFKYTTTTIHNDIDDEEY